MRIGECRKEKKMWKIWMAFAKNIAIYFDFNRWASTFDLIR